MLLFSTHTHTFIFIFKPDIYLFTVNQFVMIVVFEWKNIRNYISCFQAHNNTYLEKKNKRQYQN